MSSVLAPPTPATDGHTARWLGTHRKLLAAAMALFAERGPAEVTSTAIARRAGVATGTFYLHFEDKHALFDVLVDEALEEIRAQFSADRLAPRTDAERRNEIEGMVAVLERRRDLVRAVFDRSADNGYAERLQDRIASRIEAVYEQVFETRRCALNPGAAAQARAAVLVRVIAWWADDPGRASRSEIVDVLMELDPIRAAADATAPAAPGPTNPTHSTVEEQRP